MGINGQKAKPDKVDAKVLQIIEEQAVRPLVDVLRALQREQGRLTEASLTALAKDRLMSLTRLYGVASSYPEFHFETEHDKSRPASEPVPLPEFLGGFRDLASANLQKAGPLSSGFEARPANLSAYEKAGGMKAFGRAVSALKPEQILSEITQGGLTRKGRAWRQVAGATDDPVMVANCHAGDPVAGQASRFIERDPYTVLEGLFIAAVATGSRRGFMYLDPHDSGEAGKLVKAAEEIQRAANINFAVEVFVGSESLVGSDDSVAAASIDGNRPIPVANPDDIAVRGVWAKPTLVDSAECFAAVASSLASGGSVSTRLYQVGGEVENPGIFETAPDTGVNELLALAGASRGALVLAGGLSGAFLNEDGLSRSLYSLEREDNPRWRTVYVLKPGAMALEAAAAIAGYNGRYLCGGCIPCRIGAVRMAEMLQAESIDAGTLGELAVTLERVGLCPAGRGAAAVVASAL